MPGHLDGWSLVQFSTLNPFARANTAPDPSDGTAVDHTADESAKGHRSMRSRVLPVSAATLALILVGGTAAFAHAQKTVTLDVDGKVSKLTTFAGSVEGLLDAHDVTVGSRDDVSASGALTEGADIVVRHAHQVTVLVDGKQTSLWTTALSADDALDALSARGQSVALVATRSANRAELPLELAVNGPADVLVDGKTLPVPEADTTVGEALKGLKVTLQPLDRVSVQHADSGHLQVVVNRVVEQDVTTTVEVAFASVTQDDPTRYAGQKRVLSAGVPGVRTVVDHVTTVDGVETERVPVSDAVTQGPVNEVVGVGSKARPVRVATPAAPAASSPVAAGGSADGLNWAALAACESGGNPRSVSGSGRYYGLYQFSTSTWASVGGSGLPSQASAGEQTARAKMLYNRSGAGQWPTCGKRLFS
ncbi:resuscitation-promoting factor [Cellulomonas sp. URHD0024]|uniref:resuscitation-promoting factor n=1 Tax=Cellulomonas sp. URHD0024 TaxID=1302620 RepID=UPI0003F56DDF|nr:resuscitation-promoting factor [Cellulomonas sp. URHD0024]